MKIWIMDSPENCTLEEFPDETRIEDTLEELGANALREHEIYVSDCNRSTTVLAAYGVSQQGGVIRESSVKKHGDFFPEKLYELVR